MNSIILLILTLLTTLHAESLCSEAYYDAYLTAYPNKCEGAECVAYKA